MINPLISIITPCYNSENYISRYLDCILRQSYKNIQVILINDGSSDHTEEIILAYRLKFETQGIIFTYRYQENKGLGGAINTGLKLIQGEYFTWCDSDNYYSDNYLEKCVEFIDTHEGCNILRCDAYTVLDSNINKPISRFSDGNTDLYKRNLFDNAVLEKNFHFGCALLKTAAFDKVVQNRDIYESREGQNWQLLLPMLNSYESDYIHEPMFYFVRRMDSVSNIASSKGFGAQYAQLEEYEIILNKTISRLNVNVEKYKFLINRKYARIKFIIASTTKDKELLENQYEILKQNKYLTMYYKLIYFKNKNKLINNVYEVIKKPLQFFTKLIWRHS